jgi:hypothetical protein
MYMHPKPRVIADWLDRKIRWNNRNPIRATMHGVYHGAAGTWKYVAGKRHWTNEYAYANKQFGRVRDWIS